MNNSPTGAQPKKILVVDDNEIITKTITMKLMGAGYQVIAAMDGTGAVAALRQESPDLALLDINFPPDMSAVDWDGFRIIEWLRRLDGTRNIPVIIITGSMDGKTKDRATSAGAVAFFQKPLDYDALLKVVRATIG